ncbi:hypothetical protein DGN21_07790 [Xanthomonas sp. MLO165]|nr:hypothetical protein DGN21_07790 [Xanthomonas sp. MLO165]
MRANGERRSIGMARSRVRRGFDPRTHAVADLRKQWRWCACRCSAGRAGGPPRMTLTKAYDD